MKKFKKNWSYKKTDINNQKETEEFSPTYNEERSLEGFNDRRAHRSQETGRKTAGNLDLGK